jgi:hypothetical protein
VAVAIDKYITTERPGGFEGTATELLQAPKDPSSTSNWFSL